MSSNVMERTAAAMWREGNRHAPERGCGRRKKGGVYAVVPLGSGGKPIEEFLVDPPVPADLGSLGLSPRGAQLREYQGRLLVFDHVGSEHYPNVADFVEEARRYGVSRRLPASMEFAKLRAGTLLVLLHSRAVVENATAGRVDDTWRCPQRKEEHESPEYDGPCAQVHWLDVEGGEVIEGNEVIRSMPSFEYEARQWAGEEPPQFREGIFAVFRIGLIEVVRDPESDRYDDLLSKVQESELLVEEVDE